MLCAIASLCRMMDDSTSRKQNVNHNRQQGNRQRETGDGSCQLSVVIVHGACSMQSLFFVFCPLVYRLQVYKVQVFFSLQSTVLLSIVYFVLQKKGTYVCRTRDRIDYCKQGQTVISDQL